MNCPSRTDDTDGREGWNQSPNLLSGSTREDFNGMANARVLRRIESTDPALIAPSGEALENLQSGKEAAVGIATTMTGPKLRDGHVTNSSLNCRPSAFRRFLNKAWKAVETYSKFIGPGFMVWASYQFRLLFVVLLSNIIAIFLQSLCIKLGTVSGMDLAQMCRAHLPRWLNFFLYFLAECAVIATDIAEVIGTAIALNLLFPKLPLVAGCAISILDVLLILFFYRPDGSMKGLRAFEFFVVALVLGVVICFCIQLSLVPTTAIGEIFRGYLPSSALIEQKGLYQACGILGATVMPHSLYLGSGIVQPRLLDYDVQNGSITSSSQEIVSEKPTYQPSLDAIKFCLKYSILELAISLFTFALFVNSAILIVAGTSLTGPDAQEASLFSIHALLSSNLGTAAGTIFALALLLSGVSAGIVCTIAGQMISEGALNWSLAPWVRRLITRSISITPSIIIAAAVGQEGLTAALNGSQVALSVVLPFVSAPLIYFTCRNKFMSVKMMAPALVVEIRGRGISEGADVGNIGQAEVSRNANTSSTEEAGTAAQEEVVKLRNNWLTTIIAVLIWLLVAGMNVANLVLLGTG